MYIDAVRQSSLASPETGSRLEDLWTLDRGKVGALDWPVDLLMRKGRIKLQRIGGTLRMGTIFSVRCDDCGTEFTANLGGGFRVASFHCEKCGDEKRVWYVDGDAAVPSPCFCGGDFSADAGPLQLGVTGREFNDAQQNSAKSIPLQQHHPPQ